MNQNYDPTRQQSGNPWSSPAGGPPQQYPGGGNMQSGRNYYPSQLNTIAIIQTVLGSLEILGGIFSGIYVLFFAVLTFGIGLILVPIPLLYLTVGILSLISGINGLNKKPGYGLSLTASIGQMVLLIFCDVISFAAGLTGVILLMQDEAKAFFRR